MRNRQLACLFSLVVALCGTAQAQAPVKQERSGVAAPGELGAVGAGERRARQGLRPGAYISSRHRAQVQAWLAQHHGPGKPCLPGMQKQGEACVRPTDAPAWQIGESLPADVRLAAPPAGLMAALPRTPPGNRYALVGGDLLLVANRSRMVVDAVPMASGAAPSGTAR